LSLDIALAATGFAVFRIAPKPCFGFNILQFDTLSTDPELDNQTRLRSLIQQLKPIISTHNINVVVAEEPALALYNKNKSFLAGILKLFAACYGLLGYFESFQIYARTVQPKVWQSALLGNLEVGDSKKVSLIKANGVLRYLDVQRKLKQKDHNTADALNIGIYAIQQWHSRKWKVPYESRGTAEPLSI